jgi:hypothetical protein
MNCTWRPTYLTKFVIGLDMNVILTYVSPSILLLSRHENVTNNSHKIISIHKLFDIIFEHYKTLKFDGFQYKIKSIQTFKHL